MTCDRPDSIIARTCYAGCATDIPSPRITPVVLIAEDSSDIRALLVGLLEDEGYRTVEATDGQVALDDLMLPSKVLDKALADLAATPPGQGRIVVTGRSGSGRRTLLAALAELSGRTLATIDGAMLIREKKLGALAGLLQHATCAAGCRASTASTRSRPTTAPRAAWSARSSAIIDSKAGHFAMIRLSIALLFAAFLPRSAPADATASACVDALE